MGVSDKQCGGLLPAAIPLILFKSNTSIIDNADTGHCNEQHGTPNSKKPKPQIVPEGNVDSDSANELKVAMLPGVGGLEEASRPSPQVSSKSLTI